MLPSDQGESRLGTLYLRSGLGAIYAQLRLYGLIAALVASYKGLNAGGGPKGVGDAVNQSVVISFMLLFLTNFIITAIYFQVVPPPGL